MDKEWFFTETNDYPYESEEHKEDMYQYVNFMIYGGEKPNINEHFTDRKIYKYIEGRMGELMDKRRAAYEQIVFTETFTDIEGNECTAEIVKVST